MATIVIAITALTYAPKKAQACYPCISPFGCRCIIHNGCLPTPDCLSLFLLIPGVPIHLPLRELNIITSFRGPFNDYRKWFSSDFFDDNIIGGLTSMSATMSTIAMQQAFLVGSFFDAKQQLEVQRTFQELENEAHRDYLPSDDFCWFGTNVRGLAASESRAKYNAAAMNAASMARHLGKTNTAGATSSVVDKAARWQKFKTVYCDPQDNKWDGEAGSGLMQACGKDGGGETERLNIDIDYTRLIDQARTLDIHFDSPEGLKDESGTLISKVPPDREDVIALANNLYGHDLITRNIDPTDLKSIDQQQVYMALRSAAARRNVAENSYNTIVGLKSAGGTDSDTHSNARQFLGAILKEVGVPETEISSYIGTNPSYYAQLEILAKKIYQNPDFFANLYDKPANIQRKAIALKAIELMLDRAIFESELRQEMSTSVLLSTSMDTQLQDVSEKLRSVGGSVK